MLLRCQQHAAVRHLQTDFGTQLSQPTGGVFSKPQLFDAEPLQDCFGIGESACAGGGDQGLCERYRARSQRLAAPSFKQHLCLGMVSIVAVEVGDQHARVEDDHTGQSSRSRSSSFGR